MAADRKRTARLLQPRMRDELLDGEIFYTLKEARVIIEQWRQHYLTVRPRSALSYRPPAPESADPMDRKPMMHLQSGWTTRWGLLNVITSHGGSISLKNREGGGLVVSIRLPRSRQ